MRLGFISDLKISQDGSVIAFVLGEQIGVVHVISGEMHVRKLNYYQSSLSADGKWLAVIHESRKSNELHLYDTKGFTLKEVITQEEAFGKVQINVGGYLCCVHGRHKLAIWQNQQGSFRCLDYITYEKNIGSTVAYFHPFKPVLLLKGYDSPEKDEWGDNNDWTGLSTIKLDEITQKLKVIQEIPYPKNKQNIRYYFPLKNEEYIACAINEKLNFLNQQFETSENRTYNIHPYTNIKGSFNGRYAIYSNFIKDENGNSVSMELLGVDLETEMQTPIGKIPYPIIKGWLSTINNQGIITTIAFNDRYNIIFKQWDFEGNQLADKFFDLSEYADPLLEQLKMAQKHTRGTGLIGGSDWS